MPVILAGQGGKPFTFAKTKSPAWKFFFDGDMLGLGAREGVSGALNQSFVGKKKDWSEI